MASVADLTASVAALTDATNNAVVALGNIGGINPADLDAVKSGIDAATASLVAATPAPAPAPAPSPVTAKATAKTPPNNFGAVPLPK